MDRNLSVPGLVEVSSAYKGMDISTHAVHALIQPERCYALMMFVGLDVLVVGLLCHEFEQTLQLYRCLLLPTAQPEVREVSFKISESI